VARRDASGNIYYYFADQVGSIRTITNSGGSVCYDADYTPYGSELVHTNTCPQNYKFTGYERDSETGLDYAINRYYSSRLARFMNPDPAGLTSADFESPQSLNRYAYVENSPVSLTDPFGNDLCGSFEPNIDPSRCLTVDYNIYDASYAGHPDPFSFLISITDGPSAKVCDISSCATNPDFHNFGDELKKLPDSYLKMVYQIDCGRDPKCDKAPDFLKPFVKKITDPSTKQVRYVTDWRDFLRFGPGLPLDTSAFVSFSRPSAPPAWVNQVVAQCTRAANAIRTFINQTGSTQIPQSLLSAASSCTMHP
jgi:RHS repeat-associated protein